MIANSTLHPEADPLIIFLTNYNTNYNTVIN